MKGGTYNMKDPELLAYLNNGQHIAIAAISTLSSTKQQNDMIFTSVYGACT